MRPAVAARLSSIRRLHELANEQAHAMTRNLITELETEIARLRAENESLRARRKKT
jgi:hypothetical protein